MPQYHVSNQVDAAAVHPAIERIEISARSPDGLEYQTLLLVEGVIEASEELEFFATLSGPDAPDVRCDPWQEKSTDSGLRRYRFRGEFELLGMPSRFELGVSIATPDITPVASVNVEHSCRLPDPEAQVSPMFVTSHGRSGSSHLMGLLSRHPAIVVQGAHPFECRTANYWLHAARTLLQPARFDAGARPERFHLDLERLGPLPENSYRRSNDPTMLQSMRNRLAETTAAYCAGNIADFYQRAAEMQGKAQVRFFAEKSMPRHVPRIAAALYPGFREVVLVRDLRDVACSMRAFADQRASGEFGGVAVDDWQSQLADMQAGATRLLEYWKGRKAHAHLVRYEDLIASPETTLRQLLDYLGLSADTGDSEIAAMLEAAEKASDPSHQTTASPSHSVGRWRNEMDADLAAHATELFAPSLQAFGYLDQE